MEESSRKRVENTVGKGEIARYEQFLLFPQCFQKACTADTLKPGLVWEMVKYSSVSIGEHKAFIAVEDRDQIAQKVQSDHESIMSG